MYANVAIGAPVENTFDYHIPPELEGELVPGHLVQVSFRTAMEYAIILSIHNETPTYATKPVLARLDPRSVVNAAQIELARGLSETYLAPVGLCLWLWLPPGLTGHRDIIVELLQPDGAQTALEQEIVALLKRRGPLRGHHFNLALPGKEWRAVVDDLARTGVVKKESTVTPPRVKPKIVQTAALAIHPNQIQAMVTHLERPSRAADLLQLIADTPNGGYSAKGALKLAGATQANLDKLLSMGLVSQTEDSSIALAIPREDVSVKLAEMRKTELPLRVLKVLAREAEAMDVSWIFAQTGATMADLKRLEEEELILLGETQKWRDSLAAREFVALTPPPLTPEQDAVWAKVQSAILTAASSTPAQNEVGSKTFLLHGVTGSGKTEIYLRAIELTLSLGRSAIFLVPEIALTPQTVRRVAARFPGKVAVVHSGLSEGERYDTWRRARDGLVRIIVGARSALFTPLPDVGLIVLDEEHDSSYKQSPPILPPYYHTRQVAEQMMQQNNGVLILGGATPDIETFYRSEQGEIVRLELPRRIMGHRVRIQEQAEREGILPSYRPDEQADDALTIELPPVRMVDMREELKSGNTSIFSRPLQYAIADALERREQVILFLNRRGQNTYVFCRDCGYVVKCPRCDSPLTYHRHGQALRCHRCDYQGPEPTFCPQCGSRRIKFFGAGTQQVEQTLVEMFPRARVVRWDADTADSQEAHDDILQRFVQRKADVMVGTQMVAKGLDLPLVTLVGVVSADVGLGMPDFRAGERTFQVLTQVAGRAGRGLLGGSVILQTYQPEHYAIMAAAGHDYATFYQREIAYRREMGYPPFRRMVRILFRYPNEVKAKSEAERAAGLLRQRLKSLNMSGTELIGPAPCFYTKENRAFRWHLLLRGPDPALALRGMDIPKGWHVDVDPVEVL